MNDADENKTAAAIVMEMFDEAHDRALGQPRDQTMKKKPTNPPRMESKRAKGARLLDETLAYDGRGPRTYLARQRVAEALDLKRKPHFNDLMWLQHVADAGRST